MSAHLLDGHYEKLESLLSVLDQIFITGISQEVENHLRVLEEIESNLNSFARMKPEADKGIGLNDVISRFHSQNLEVLSKFFLSVSSESFLNKVIAQSRIEINQFLENTPETLRIEYPPEYFQVLREYPFHVKVLYSFEAGGIRLRRVCLKTGNFFRSLLKIKQKKEQNRVLKVYFKQMIKGFFFPRYISSVSLIVKERQRQLIESYMRLLDLEYEFVHKDYSLENEVISKNGSGGLNIKVDMASTFFDENKNEMGLMLQRSGMLLNAGRWKSLGRNLDFKKAMESLTRLGRSWQSTFFAFFEDWRFREQLFAYMHSVRLSFSSMELIYSERLESSLFPEVKKQIGSISELKERLPDPDQSEMDSIRSFFVSELYRFKKRKLNEEQNISLLKTAGDIPKLLQKLDNEVSEKLDIFQDKVGIVGSPKYLSGIKASEIYYFSPREFIGFECLPVLQNKLILHGDELKNELDVIINEFGEYDQIIDFYLDSTISLSEKQGVRESEVISFFREGLSRLLKISHKISEALEVLQKQKLSELSDIIREYQEDVFELDDNNNIVNIYARLIKSKAFAESRSKRNKLLHFSRRNLSWISATFEKRTSWLKLAYTDLKLKLRLGDFSTPISSEISNQLIDIQQRVFTLPVIYQHLFENSPIREFNLFLSREKEINVLNTAHADWLKGNFAASLVTGENGSGKSSLLYFYSKSLKTNHQIHSFQVSRFYFTEADYFTLIGEIFKKPDLHSDEAIEAFISSFKERRIMIIDGMERLFIRKVNGFGCIQKLLSLIVSSNHKIFWICSVSRYASTYLNKTIGISEYFDYNIRVDSLSSKQIQDIVLKRNRLSGFRVTYLADKLSGEDAKTKKMSQVDLQDKFFAELNLFAGSNISLSLNYWLQSIQSIQEDHVEICSFEAPDFGFLENISPEKAYTLLVVVMHGKITVDQHALIFNQKKEKSYKVLNILGQDSILVKQNDYFILNSILFRHVVRVLENRNLIH